MGPDFLVVIDSAGSNTKEWRRALSASDSDLRVEELTDEQRRVAVRLGVSFEDYARGLLAHRFGRERRESEARALGQHVVELVRGLGDGYVLRMVSWDGDRLRWMLQFQTPERVVGVPVPFELAEDIIDSGVLSKIETLRTLLLEGLGRRDLVS